MVTGGSKRKRRKKVPQPPKWFWLETDDCWFCGLKQRCSDCKVLKKYVHEQRNKKKHKEKFDI